MTANKPTSAETPQMLSPRERLERARAHNTGNRAWRAWKDVEAIEVVELFEQANRQSQRVDLLDIRFDGDLLIAYRVRMPVPRKPIDGKLRLGHSAGFRLHYRENWRWEAPAGWEPLGLFDPLDPFHPNLSPALLGAICLGMLPPGVAVKELILMGYYALTLQNHVLDETDPHGVLNIAACDFYRNHQEYLPLTRAGLADAWEPPKEETETIRI